jgi:hypothetical protein
MGSPWKERRTDNDESSMDRLGTLPAKPGLEAAELELLRRAPDYDAEEMASVRPCGGWPVSFAQPAAPLAEAVPIGRPARPSWLPPNRIEPPATRVVPVEVPFGALAPEGAGETVWTRFPEERTMALMAEDLLGRPLDERKPAMAAPVPAPGTHAAAWIPRSATGGADLWDAAMPLVAEG